MNIELYFSIIIVFANCCYIYYKFFYPWNFIHNKLIPTYDRLQSQHGAKYPTVMYNVYFSEDSKKMGFDASKSICYITDSSFHFYSMINTKFSFEIPFERVLFHDCELIYSDITDYRYRIDFDYESNDNSTKLEGLSFTTLKNHKYDKQFGTRLTGEELYNFICENFPTRKEYYDTH